MSERRVFEVNAEPIGRQWGLTVPDAPGAVSLVRALSSAEAHSREAIAFVLDIAEDSFDVHVNVQLDEQVERELVECRSMTADAESMARHAGERTRALVATMKADGLSGSDIATILGVSPQRVSQLANS